MNAIRHSRLFIAFVAMFGMLFMQLAMAGYVCPQLEPMTAERMTPVMVAEDATMLPCHEMDQEEPNLCSAHAQEGNQSLDKPELPSVQQFVAATLTGIVMPVETSQFTTAVALEDAFLLTRATAPPLAIQHCCFRT